jgi:hypothetical protein
MNRTLRRMKAAKKKWSMFEKWLGARITGPLGGTRSAPTPRARNSVQAQSEVTTRTISYMTSGSRRRERAWKRSKYSAGRGSL